MPLYGVTRLYGVPAGTVRRWLHEGKLTRHGTKPYLVDTDEVELLAGRHIRAFETRHATEVAS